MSEQIRIMFSDLSESYDLGNDVLSLGIHRRWKRKFVRKTRAGEGDRVLDLATGTGDIAFLFSKAVGETGAVVGVDFSPAMIARAKERAMGGRPNTSFEVGDGMGLKFPDDSFDVSSISFGVRNVDDPVKVLREMKRVVKSGGRVAVLEMGQPSGAFAPIYRFLSSKVFPVLGGVVSGQPEAYKYLHTSSSSFPCGEKFVKMMKMAGLQTISVEKLFGGIAYIYIAEVE